MSAAQPIADTWFENARMGHRARLVVLPGETGGRRFVMEYVNRPRCGQYAVPPHLHPAFTETFEILRGRARYRIGHEERDAEVGERVVMPPGVAHVHPWSVSDEELHVRQTVDAEPADLQGLIAGLQGAITIFGLATAGRVDAKGMPNLLQVAVIIDTTMPGTFLEAPSRGVQRAAFGALAAIGRALGYRATYPEFGALTAEGVFGGVQRAS